MSRFTCALDQLRPLRIRSNRINRFSVIFHVQETSEPSDGLQKTLVANASRIRIFPANETFHGACIRQKRVHVRIRRFYTTSPPPTPKAPDGYYLPSDSNVQTRIWRCASELNQLMLHSIHWLRYHKPQDHFKYTRKISSWKGPSHNTSHDAIDGGDTR